MGSFLFWNWFILWWISRVYQVVGFMLIVLTLSQACLCQGNGCSTAAECIPDNQEVTSSNPAGRWALFLLFLSSCEEVLRGGATYWFSWQKNAELCSLKQNKLNMRRISQKACLCWLNQMFLIKRSRAKFLAHSDTHKKTFDEKLHMWWFRGWVIPN